MLARSLAPIALLVLATLPARAQDTTAHPARGQDTIAHPGAWLLGAGANLSDGVRAAPAFQLGREWRAPNSRFGLRLEGAYAATSERTYQLYDFSSGDYAPTGRSTERNSNASVSLLTTFALTTGRIQPYLVSGFVYQRRYTRTEITTLSTSGSPGAGTLSVVPGTYRAATNDLGAVAGFGLQARAGGMWLFLERKSQLTSNYAAWRAPHPITLGIRF